jgi:uncharacterized protein
MSRTAIAALYDLQQLDLELDRAATELEALRRALAEDATRSARESAARARARAERARRDAREAESAVHEAEARIQKQESRLYGGGAAMRDLSALQTELVHLKQAHADMEERALPLMLAAEEAEAEMQRAAEAYAAAERDWERRRGELGARIAAAEAALAGLRTRRETQVAAIEPAMLGRYEASRRSHGGRGVSLAQNGTCQACRVVLASGTVQRARSGAELVPCTNCGRILYVP